jgi:hypothetical protein
LGVPLVCYYISFLIRIETLEIADILFFLEPLKHIYFKEFSAMMISVYIFLSLIGTVIASFNSKKDEVPKSASRELFPKPRHTFSLGHRRSQYSRRRMQRQSENYLSTAASKPELAPVFTGYGQ